MAKLDVPTVRDLYDAFIEDYKSRTGQTTPFLGVAFIRLLAWPYAGLTVLCYRFGQWVYFQMFIETCAFEALRLYGYRVGVDYNDGTNTLAEVTLTGVTALSVNTGTLFTSPRGLTYKTSEATPVINGVAVCVVTSTQTGSQTVLNPGDIMSVTVPQVNVPDTGTVTAVTTEGEDPEAQEAYRLRVQNRYRLQPQGGAFADYFLWSVEVPGIVDAFPYVVNPGITTVLPVAEGSGSARTPSAVKLQEVTASIRQSPDSNVYDRHPVQATLNVQPPTYVLATVEISGLDLTANTNQNRADIKAAIIAYLDTRRPEIPALDYTAAGATVSEQAISAEASEVLDVSPNPGTFDTIEVEVDSAALAGKYQLGVGELVNLNTITINGSVVP